MSLLCFDTVDWVIFITSRTCMVWSGVPRIVRELSGNFVVSGEWSPYIYHSSVVLSLDSLNHNFVVPAQWLLSFRTLIVHVTYLLTYLLSRNTLRRLLITLLACFRWSSLTWLDLMFNNRSMCRPATMPQATLKQRAAMSSISSVGRPAATLIFPTWSTSSRRLNEPTTTTLCDWMPPLAVWSQCYVVYCTCICVCVWPCCCCFCLRVIESSAYITLVESTACSQCCCLNRDYVPSWQNFLGLNCTLWHLMILGV